MIFIFTVMFLIPKPLCRILGGLVWLSGTIWSHFVVVSFRLSFLSVLLFAFASACTELCSVSLDKGWWVTQSSQYVVYFFRYCKYDFSFVWSASIWWMAHLCWNAGAHIQQILWSSEIWWVVSKSTLAVTQVHLEEQNIIKFFTWDETPEK